MGINVRFVGEEPLDNVTRQYNEALKRELPKYGIELKEIQRLSVDGEAISASKVRRLLKDGAFDEIKNIVPGVTYDYLVERYSNLTNIIKE